MFNSWEYRGHMTTPEAVPSKRRFKKWQVALLIFAVLAIIGQITGGNSGTGTSNLSAEQQRQKASDELTQKYQVEPAWYPDGFTEFSSNLAWRWGTKAETNCSYSSGACWSVMVISKSGCPSSLYGEIKIFDASDVQIDYTNDTTSTVSPLQKVKLTFDTFNKEAETAQIGELSCY
jgi:hypothetical protein